ncbi:unnamed protein product [Cochlearia groenlandica]
MIGGDTISGNNNNNNVDLDVSKVKAPNMFERAKEEIEAVIGAIHQRKSSRDESDKMELKSDKSGDVKKKPSMLKKAKEEIKSLFNPKVKPHRCHRHHESARVDEVKVENVSEIANEVIDDGLDDSPKGSFSVVLSEKERAGLGCSLGEGLEKICAPWGDNKKD